MMDNLPPAVRQALEQGDPQALQAALSALPREQAREIVQQLKEAGIIEVGESEPLDMQRLLAQLDPFLRAVVAVARGEEAARPQVEQALADLESKGWQLREPIQRLWAGERDPEALTNGLDESDTQIIWQILAMLEEPAPAEIGATLPPEIVAAFESGDYDRFQAALAALPEEEREAVVGRLASLARQAGMEDGIEEEVEVDLEAIQQQFEPLLREIAEIAKGHGRSRAEIDALLLQLEEKGWQLLVPVHRIWAGERDMIALTAGIDSNSAHLVARILELIHEHSPEDTLDEIPSAVRVAFESGDPEQAMAALQSLPPVEQRQVMQKLRQAAREFLEDFPPEIQREMLAQIDQMEAQRQPGALTDRERLLQQFDPLLRGIASVARGNEALREQVNHALSQIEVGGWHLSAPVQQLWAGERDEATLTVGLDETDTLLVQRLLELVAQPSREEVIAALPEGVRQAIEAQDVPGLRAALAALPDAEAEQAVAQMRRAGIIE